MVAVAVPRWLWNRVMVAAMADLEVCPRGHWVLVLDMDDAGFFSWPVEGRLTRESMHARLDIWLDSIMATHGPEPAACS